MKDKSSFIKNIYYMLCYAFKSLHLREYESIGAESFDNIHNLFACLLSKGIARQLKQGLYREYANRKEDLATLRGRIDLPGSLQNQIARKRRLCCEFDELSENNLLNQILKTTVLLLLAHPDVEQAYKRSLKKEMRYFCHVDTLDPRSIRWSSIQYQRNSASYQMLMSLCRFILESLLLTSKEGEYRLASFIDERRLETLYEKFILEFYRKECPEIKASASKIAWALDEDFDNDSAILPSMRSDIMLTNEDKTLIIDAKYYSNTFQEYYGKQSLHSGHLYQIFAYVKNKQAQFLESTHEVFGLLLYASIQEQSQPDYSFKLDGNRFSASTLDLNQDFSLIASQLKSIVSEYFN